MALTGWLEFFTAGLATHLDVAKVRGQRAICRDVLVRQHPLFHRQAAARSHVIEHGRLTTQDYEGLSPRKSRRTLKRDLKSLLEEKPLADSGVAPTDPTRHHHLADGIWGSGPEL